MSVAAEDVDDEAVVSRLSNEELLESVHRCQRLLKQPLVLGRLPGKEAELRSKLRRYEAALEQRNLQPSKSAEPSTTGVAPLLESRRQKDLAFQQQMGERYRHCRTDFEQAFRQSCSTLLNETEIQRRLAEIPNPRTYLMTYDETMTMERQSLARARERELTRIRLRNEALLLKRSQELHPQAGDDSSISANEVTRQIFGE